MPKAYAYTRIGGPETETFIERNRPEPGPGQLLVAVRAAGVNPVDWKMRNGFRRPGAPERPLPAVFGNEIAGVVVALGPDVTGFEVGDAVFGSPVGGGYAEYALLPVSIAAHKPQELSFADAATLPVAAATAYDGVRQLALPAGATLLITGIGGGVGVAAAQIARAFGLRVVGTASEGKKDFVEALGAVHVPSAGAGLADRIRAAAPGGTVDAVFDLVGGEALTEVAGLVEDRTKLITAADPTTAIGLGGSHIRRAHTAEVLDEVAKLVTGGALRPHVTAVFPLQRAADALRTVEDGHARGKVVIEVSP
ncbi:NADP-dependent oxidoreductase [Streptomyces sp. NPDC020719]|uniref:NADP-dependent oxidoreductase n=1 Tax=unclassified Streptomyces TaxID=2593676 RepID=UPI0033E988A8